MLFFFFFFFFSFLFSFLFFLLLIPENVFLLLFFFFSAISPFFSPASLPAYARFLACSPGLFPGLGFMPGTSLPASAGPPSAGARSSAWPICWVGRGSSRESSRENNDAWGLQVVYTVGREGSRERQGRPGERPGAPPMVEPGERPGVSRVGRKGSRERSG